MVIHTQTIRRHFVGLALKGLMKPLTKSFEKMPKGDTLISQHVLEIGVASAVIDVNDGVVGLSRIFHSFDLFRKYAKEWVVEKDNIIIKMKKKT